MTHTKRIYNNPKIKKAQRYNIDDNKPHFIIGIPFTRRSWMCMGKCSMCRDKNREPRLIRKRLREQLRFELRKELKVD